MVKMTLSLPPHQKNCFKKIISGITTIQTLIGVDKWHRVLGELRSMDIALPGAWALFSHIQEALYYVDDKRINLTRGFHQALEDFHWLA